MNPSLLSYCGHIQGRVEATISEDRQKLITLGIDDLVNLWDINDMTSRQSIELSNPNSENFTCIEYNQRQKMFVLGTESGTVYKMNQNDTSTSQIIYKSKRPIASLKYSRNYNYLGIAPCQPCGVLYCEQRGEFYRCNTQHQNEVTFARLTNDEKCMVTVGNDGFANIYRVSLESSIPIEQVHRYRMCHKTELKPLTMCCEHPTQLGHLLFSGSTTLQQIFVTPDTECFYQIKADIYEDTEILALCWLNDNIIGMATDSRISLWNYVTKARVHVINYITLRPILSDFSGKLLAASCQSVDGHNSNSVGLVYKYENHQFISKENEQAIKFKERLQNEANGIMPRYEEPDRMQQRETKPIIEPKKVKKVEPDYASKLIVEFPQTSLESSYSEYNNAQFFFYNQHGCVVGRTDGEKKSYELEYHDKFKLRRIKFQSDDRYICYFMLSENCFMYSSQTHVYFEMQSTKRNKRDDGSMYKEPCLIKWDYKLDKIEGFGIGNCWVAIVCLSQIYIFDYMGNELHCISYDRQYLAMAVYQDILALVYDAQVPLAESQLFEVKLYKIESKSWRLQRIIRMPVSCGQKLKWFGFSEEGCLYSHDTSETVRMYCWDSNEWTTVFTIDSSLFSIFIQHIQNNEIYGFKIEQENDQPDKPSMPTVMPRSLPRKIAFEMADRKLSYFSEDQNKKLIQVIIRRLSLLHQKFRTRRWYKHKYARRQYHPLFKQSEKIMGEEDIDELMTRHDIQIVDLLKKIMPGLQARTTSNQIQAIRYELSGLCSSLVFFQESTTKIAQILQSSHYVSQYTDPIDPAVKMRAKKYGQLSRLEAMVDMGWIDRSDQ